MGFFASRKAKEPVQPESIARQVSINLRETITVADREATRVLENLRQGKSIPASSFHFLVLKDDSITAWNDNHFLPLPHTLTDDFEIKFLKNSSGEFVARKWKINESKSLIAIIPLHTQYRITNKYLTPYWNRDIFHSHDVTLIDSFENGGYTVEFNGQIIFKIQPAAQGYAKGVWSDATVIFFSLFLVGLLSSLFDNIKNLSKRKPASGFLMLTLGIVVIRGGMILLEFPAQFTDSPVFDAKNFASSELNPSLGDLLLNSVSVLVLCVYLFGNYHRFSFFQHGLKQPALNIVLSAFSTLCVLFGMLFPFVVIQTIYNNSSLTLSVAQSIHFDLLRILALLSVVLTSIGSFLFMHVFIRLLTLAKRRAILIISVAGGTVIFIAINEMSGQLYLWSLLTGIIYIVCVLIFTLYRSLARFQYTTFSYFLLAVIFLALNGMFAVRNFEQQANVMNQFRFAGTFLAERDYFGEYLLQETIERVSSDVFIQRRMSNPFLSKEIIRQKIKQVSLSGYFNRYNVEVLMFNAVGEPLEQNDTTTFSDLLNAYQKDVFKTDYEGVYCVTSPQEGFSRKYVVLIRIARNEVPAGFVVIELSLKRIIPENVYPELLVDSRFQQGYNTQNWSYAIVYDKEILYGAGDFNYESFVQNRLGTLALYSKGIKENGYLHTAIEDANERITIVSSPLPPLNHWFADFSFQVITGMLVVLIYLLVQALFNYYGAQSLFLSARIQLILNLAFFLPLIAVSIVTLGLTTQSSQEQLSTEYLSKANRFGGTVALALYEHKSDVNEFENQFTRLTTLANLDANVFYPDGKLMATSQPLIFENHLLAPYISPRAFKRIRNGDRVFISSEQVGSLKFNVAYTTLFSPENGEQSGILAIPFFQSEASLEHLQITVFANIISIFTIIFLIFLAVSFMVTRWLTAPLQLIARTIGRVSLLGTNKPLEWKSDDEIGLMVREYNQMLLKLNDSKQELERTQRERAWREIAQQVAHEIKNPLTPMKLTLQQLERSMQKEDQPDEKLKNTVSSLLSQVNSLDDIASSFSSFARMPEPVMAEVELVGLLTKAIDLHSQEGKIQLEATVSSAAVEADSQLLGRIFSNIILNGLQAAVPGTKPEINIALTEHSNNYRVSFTDKGKGIEPSLADKIFLPHFTTKKSGSGLGLAIAKQGIEQMGGKIWFETSIKGTIFIIELPKV